MYRSRLSTILMALNFHGQRALAVLRRTVKLISERPSVLMHRAPDLAGNHHGLDEPPELAE